MLQCPRASQAEDKNRMPPSNASTGEKRNRNHRYALRWRLLLWILVFSTLWLAILILDGQVGSGTYLVQAQVRASATFAQQTGTSSATPTLSNPSRTPQPQITKPSNTGTHTQTGPPPQQLEESPANRSLAEEGVIFFSMSEGGYAHIFAYHPQFIPFTRLTNGPWDDIHPAPSPDGSHLAFSSNRNGHWDLYILNWADGEITQITDTPQYEGAPTWSPDNQWLVYESYVPLNGTNPPAAEFTTTATPAALGENLEIFILQINPDNPAAYEPIRLTDSVAADHSPVWSPGGRQIAFVSDRSGDPEVWLADLDRIEDRFQNISNNPRAADSFPAWSPDGRKLAWASKQDGFENIVLSTLDQLPGQAQLVGNGSQPAWNPAGGELAAMLLTPNRTYLTAYKENTTGIAIPPIPLSGSLSGLAWGKAFLPNPLPPTLRQAAEITPTPAWMPVLTPMADVPGARQHIAPLADVEAPYPFLHDLVDESFLRLRSAVTAKIGWDSLSTLENAYVPLTSPLFPGMLDDWLYTGRAFTMNSGPVNAGWMVVVREDYGASTYWRIYLRTRFQDGSQGLPMRELPWNINIRYNGDPRSYEQGGDFASAIPSGYWVDFSRLAADFGWERLPALITWRSAIPASRYNKFVFPDQLTWESAMYELYPESALYTPTYMAPPSLTPTKTRWPTSTPTASRTPRATTTPRLSVTPTP